MDGLIATVKEELDRLIQTQKPTVRSELYRASLEMARCKDQLSPKHEQIRQVLLSIPALSVQCYAVYVLGSAFLTEEDHNRILASFRQNLTIPNLYDRLLQVGLLRKSDRQELLNEIADLDQRSNIFRRIAWRRMREVLFFALSR